jgi:hypothetical protein
MNRIRKYADKFQVLITPTNHYDTQFEVLLGGWTDEYLRNFTILEFDTLAEAQCEAFKHPDIDWMRMVLYHKSAFHDIKKLISESLDKYNFIVDFVPQFMEPDHVKNSIFDRVMFHQDRFTLVYHMNDIISYHIINPWSQNVQEIASNLVKNQKLRIFKSFNKHGVIHLVGKNDLGTTYEIAVWPTIMAQWARWVEKNKNIRLEVKKKSLEEAIKKQKEFDIGFSIR